jgi:hypothetical protein
VEVAAFVLQLQWDDLIALGDEQNEDTAVELERRVDSLQPNKCCMVLHTVSDDIRLRHWIEEEIAERD